MVSEGLAWLSKGAQPTLNNETSQAWFWEFALESS